MAHLAFACLSHSLAHAGRDVRLARELVARGHRVTLIGAPGFFGDPAVVRPGECPVEVLPEPPLGEVLSPARGRSARAETGRFLQAMDAERALLRRLRPDALVVDNRRSALVSAELLRIPTLSLTTANLMGPHCPIAPTLEEYAHICGPVLGASPDAVLSQPSFTGWELSRRLPLRPAPLPRELTVGIGYRGGRPRRAVHDLTWGDRTALLDPPAFAPARGLPPSAEQVGPVFPELDVPLPPWWHRLDASRPLVYLTFGSTGRPEAFRRVLGQLAATGLQVVVASAGMAPPHPDVFTARFLPGEAILSRASVVVSHGGTLTVYHALAHGVPQLVVPSHMEQAITAVGLVQQGLGLTVSQAEVDRAPALLPELVQVLLHAKALRERLSAWKAHVNGDSALTRVADLAESLT